MASVTQITQYLYRSDPQKTQVRLTLYHYLKNACDLGMDFKSSLSSQFLDHCLQFLYWREKQTEIASELHNIITELHSQGLIDDSLEKFNWLRSLQVVQIHHSSERLIALKKHLKETVTDLKHRIVSGEGDKLICISLLSSGGLRISSYGTFYRISNGELVPLSPVSDIEYTSYMELMPGRLQHLNIDGVRTVHFSLEDHSYMGRIVQGHHFQKAGSIQTREIASLQEVFFGLKALEKFFIDPKSDPFYNELIDQLERAYHLLSSKDPRGYQVAPALLKKGQVALRNIFQKDKLLLLLVTNIEYMLNLHQPNKNQTESGSQAWHKVRPLPR